MVCAERLCCIAFGLAIGCAQLAAAGDGGALELQVRTNIVDGYNVPPNSSYNSKTPSLADDDRVAVSLSIVGGDVDTVGLWLGGGGAGSVVWTDGGGPIISDCSLNGDGLAVFQLSFASPDGLYFYDDSDGSSGLLTTRPIGTSAWTGAEVNASGQVGFRASFSGDYAWVSYDGELNPPFHAVVADLDPTSPYWYLYTPSFNDQRVIAGKVSLASDHDADQIVACTAAGDCTVLVEDQDADPGSPFTGFGNSVSLTSNGRVAFTAGLVSGGEGVFITDGVETTTIATTDHPEVSAIDFFAPAANDSGQVVFRAFDGAGLRAVLVGDGSELDRVATEHDLVATDLGEARIDQHDDSPVFGGSPGINAAGDVAFIASLTPADNNQIEWGSGAVHLARQQRLRRRLRVRRHQRLVDHRAVNPAYVEQPSCWSSRGRDTDLSAASRDVPNPAVAAGRGGCALGGRRRGRSGGARAADHHLPDHCLVVLRQELPVAGGAADPGPPVPSLSRLPGCGGVDAPARGGHHPGGDVAGDRGQRDDRRSGRSEPARGGRGHGRPGHRGDRVRGAARAAAVPGAGAGLPVLRPA